MERDQATKFINDLLRLMLSRNGSDLFITADFPPAIKVDGKITKVSNQALTGNHTLALARSIMRTTSRWPNLSVPKSATLPWPRLRWALSRQHLYSARQGGHGHARGAQAIPTLDGLGMPAVLKDIALTKRGLVVFVGATGSGKSTTQAAMIDWRNEHSFWPTSSRWKTLWSLYTRIKLRGDAARSGALDTDSWQAALKNALRQAPDVIFDGRDPRPRNHGLGAGLCRDRPPVPGHAACQQRQPGAGSVINFFPEDRAHAVADGLVAQPQSLVSRRLVPKQSGVGCIVAVEIMLNSPLISGLIFKGEVAGNQGDHEKKPQPRYANL